VLEDRTTHRASLLLSPSGGQAWGQSATHTILYTIISAGIHLCDRETRDALEWWCSRFSYYAASFLMNVLTALSLESLCRESFRRYHGALNILRRIRFGTLCRIRMLASAAQSPHRCCTRSNRSDDNYVLLVA